jgi:hypothetical protein
MNRLALALCLFWPGAGQSGEVRQGEVDHDAGRYVLRLIMDVDADSKAVYGIVTDFDRMHRISAALSESHRMEPPGASRDRRKLVVKTCILFFCLRAVLVEDIEYAGAEIIRTTVVPALSDFRSGRMEWQVSPVGSGRTRIRLFCEIEPDFWIPPLIGPWVIKRKMLDEARETVNRIEALAAGG